MITRRDVLLSGAAALTVAAAGVPQMAMADGVVSAEPYVGLRYSLFGGRSLAELLDGKGWRIEGLRNIYVTQEELDDRMEHEREFRQFAGMMPGEADLELSDRRLALLQELKESGRLVVSDH